MGSSYTSNDLRGSSTETRVPEGVITPVGVLPRARVPEGVIIPVGNSTEGNSSWSNYPRGSSKGVGWDGVPEGYTPVGVLSW